MKVPLEWLGSLVPVPESPEELVERLTEAGLECELAGLTGTHPLYQLEGDDLTTDFPDLRS